MNVEYTPWYQAAAVLLRCSVCGCMVSSADTVAHEDWHQTIGA